MACPPVVSATAIKRVEHPSYAALEPPLPLVNGVRGKNAKQKAQKKTSKIQKKLKYHYFLTTFFVRHEKQNVFLVTRT